MRKIAVAITALLLACTAFLPGVAMAASLSGDYLMAFHACDSTSTSASCSSPSNHVTYIAQSSDGATWETISSATPFSGSVPDVIRRGNTIYIYNPQQLHRYDIAAGTMSSGANVTILDSTGANESFVDPSAFIDSSGRIVLFYLYSTTTSGDPARCASGETSCTKYFKSATEVAGSDGATFIVDSGLRASVTITSDQSASDPDIFEDGTGYVMLISMGSSVKAVSSTTLAGTYSDISGLSSGMLTTSGGVPAGFYDRASAKYWIYVTANTGQSGSSVIKRAAVSNLNSSISDSQFTTVLSGSGVTGLSSNYLVASPGIARNTSCVATYSNGVLSVPDFYAAITQYHWSLSMTYITGSANPSQFDLTSASSLSSAQCTAPATYSDGTLTIPLFSSATGKLWGLSMEYDSATTSSWRFNLTGATAK